LQSCLILPFYHFAILPFCHFTILHLNVHRKPVSLKDYTHLSFRLDVVTGYSRQSQIFFIRKSEAKAGRKQWVT